MDADNHSLMANISQSAVYIRTRTSVISQTRNCPKSGTIPWPRGSGDHRNKLRIPNRVRTSTSRKVYNYTTGRTKAKYDNRARVFGSFFQSVAHTQMGDRRRREEGGETGSINGSVSAP